MVKVYYKKCFYCNYRVLRGAQSEYSFHRFPKDPSTKNLWKKFCKLSDVDDVKNVFLCSKHFKKSDFIVTKAEQPGNGGARLNHDAVPTVRSAATPPTGKQFVEPVQLEIKANPHYDPSDLELSIPTQIVVKSNPTPELPTLESLIQDIQDFSDEQELENQTDTALPIVSDFSEDIQFLTEAQVFSGKITGVSFPDQVQFITEALPIVSDGYISYLSFIKHVSKNYVLESLNTLQFLSETELAFADAQELLRDEAKRPKSVRRKHSKVRKLKRARYTVAMQRRKLAAIQQRYKRLFKRVKVCKEVIANFQEQSVISKEIADQVIKVLRGCWCPFIYFC